MLPCVLPPNNGVPAPGSSQLFFPSRESYFLTTPSHLSHPHTTFFWLVTMPSPCLLFLKLFFLKVVYGSQGTKIILNLLHVTSERTQFYMSYSKNFKKRCTLFLPCLAKVWSLGMPTVIMHPFSHLRNIPTPCLSERKDGWVSSIILSLNNSFKL